MSEFVVSTVQRTPVDIEICELTATITDTGVSVTAKSPIIAEFIASKSSGTHNGSEYVSAFKGLKFHSIPSRLANDINGNGIYGDMFFASRMDAGGNRSIPEPNMVWMRSDKLAEGVTVVFPQPAHVPADLIEYLNRSMEKVRTFYMKNVRKVSIKSTLVERLDG
jgi:hypothetical protein